MVEIELEKTYLLKNLPEGWKDFSCKEVFDIYFPVEAKHPVLRLRKKGDSYEMTKKEPAGEDLSEIPEHTIHLSKGEFESLAGLAGKKVRKMRYFFDHGGVRAELGIFKDDLEGLALIDFEFDSVEKKNTFKQPDFCLVDVTNEEMFAGGMLCGKKYSDVEKRLKELGYSPIRVS
jgi:CYTH domain-containing protein